MEIWKDIENYKGLYEVSDQGKIRSNKFGKVHIMKPGGGKYPTVALFKNNQREYFSVAGLVAAAFLPSRPSNSLIVRIDPDNSSNHASNLKYGSRQEVTRRGYPSGGLKTHNEQKTRPVIQTTIQGEFMACYPSTREAARQTGVSHSNIIFSCQGKIKTAGGYKWKYKNQKS